MIQRIQTIYLLLVVFLNAGFLFTPIFDQAEAYPDSWLVFLLSTALTLSTVLSFITIFIYKNRKLQTRFCVISMISQVVVIGTSVGVLLSMGTIDSSSVMEIIGVVMVVFAWLFLFLANKAIQKDDKLVRSMDRIR